MEKKEFDRFNKVVSIVARKLGFSSEAEDIASHIMLKKLDGGGQKQNVYYSVIDYLRTHGLGTRRGEPRKSYFPLSDNDGEETADVIMALSYGNRTTSRDVRDSLADFEKTIELCKLRKEDRAVLVLYYVYGFELKEIGIAFGISESAISQWKTSLEEKIKPKIKAIING